MAEVPFDPRADVDADLRSVLNCGMGDSDDGWYDAVTDQIEALRGQPELLRAILATNTAHAGAITAAEPPHDGTPLPPADILPRRGETVAVRGTIDSDDIAPDWTRTLNGEHGRVVDIVGRHVRVLVVVPVEVSIPLTDVHPPEQETR